MLASPGDVAAAAPKKRCKLPDGSAPQFVSFARRPANHIHNFANHIYTFSAHIPFCAPRLHGHAHPRESGGSGIGDLPGSPVTPTEERNSAATLAAGALVPTFRNSLSARFLDRMTPCAAGVPTVPENSLHPESPENPWGVAIEEGVEIRCFEFEFGLLDRITPKHLTWTEGSAHCSYKCVKRLRPMLVTQLVQQVADTSPPAVSFVSSFGQTPLTSRVSGPAPLSARVKDREHRRMSNILHLAFHASHFAHPFSYVSHEDWQANAREMALFAEDMEQLQAVTASPQEVERAEVDLLRSLFNMLAHHLKSSPFIRIKILIFHAHLQTTSSSQCQPWQVRVGRNRSSAYSCGDKTRTYG